MTHEELLAKIEELSKTIIYNADDPVFYKALRAVVELHRSFDNLAGEFCTICTAMEDKDIYTLYPCPTIQTITKELSV